MSSQRKNELCILAAILLMVTGLAYFFGHRASSVHGGATVVGSAAAAESGSVVVIADSTKGNRLAEHFQNGSLPQPLPNSNDDADLAAHLLVQKISTNDGNSAPAFLSTLRRAGIGVSPSDRRLLLDGGLSSQWITLHDWEVAAMLKLYGEGLTLKLQDVSDAMAQPRPRSKANSLILSPVTWEES
jgi:hypothetical protein